jgi:DNA-3-methyladenine glycosylase
MLNKEFFDRDAIVVAKDLLGKVLRVKYKSVWLSASIIETEAYYLEDKASHASLGYTEKRKALFMSAGTIYMYYCRGQPALNVSVNGRGCAVLIKSGFFLGDEKTLLIMQKLNPKKDLSYRSLEKLCAGQTLLCRSLGLTVKAWDQRQFDFKKFYIEDIGYRVEKIIQTRRLGIPLGRAEHLPYRFIDASKAEFCTKKPRIT